MRIIGEVPLVCLLLVAAPATAAPPAAAPTAPMKQTRDPRAIAALESMGAFLRSLTTMRILGETITDDVLGDNQKVQYSGMVELTARRPDRMRANVISDRKNEQIFYDGKQFTVYQPSLGYYASFAAPPTLAGLIDIAEKRYGLDLPLVDLFAWGTERSRPADILTATHVGTSTIKGTGCDHYAFHQADVDWQVWIQQGARPLPRKLVITTITERSQPEYSVVYTWDLAPAVSDQFFTFTPPPGTHRIDFETIGPSPVRQGRPTPKQPRGATP
jgi:hypothetical protein